MPPQFFYAEEWTEDGRRIYKNEREERRERGLTSSISKSKVRWGVCLLPSSTIIDIAGILAVVGLR